MQLLYRITSLLAAKPTAQLASSPALPPEPWPWPRASPSRCASSPDVTARCRRTQCRLTSWARCSTWGVFRCRPRCRMSQAQAESNKLYVFVFVGLKFIALPYFPQSRRVLLFDLVDPGTDVLAGDAPAEISPLAVVVDRPLGLRLSQSTLGVVGRRRRALESAHLFELASHMPQRGRQRSLHIITPHSRA
jgi:hypothetical protein